MKHHKTTDDALGYKIPSLKEIQKGLDHVLIKNLKAGELPIMSGKTSRYLIKIIKLQNDIIKGKI